MAGAIVLLAALGAKAAPEGSLLAGVRPGADGIIDVLTLFAHQDDESIPAGGTLLKLVRDPRVRLHIACMTLGDMSEAKDFLDITPEHLGRIRTKELETAAAVYGAEQVIQLQYHDQGLESADQAELVALAAKIMADTGAEIVITHEPAGITQHPDHIVCSRVATIAFQKSGAQRLYYATLPRSLYLVRATITPFGKGPEPAYPTVKVDITGQMKLKRLAMYAHASQKHFSFVGIAMDWEAMIPYEWFALAEKKQR